MDSARAIFTAILLALPMAAQAAPPVVPGLRPDLDLDPAAAGHVLLSELNCTACHGGDTPAKGVPDLSGAGARIHPDYLAEFIADPHATKPGTTMPDMLGELGASERRQAARAIADFIAVASDDSFEVEAIDPEAADRGRDLFGKIGCAACHSPAGETLEGSAPLHRLAEKYSLTSLTAFLEDPLAVRPGGRMPDLQLDHWEAIDIASHLLRGQELQAPAAPDPERAKQGKALFQKFACSQCHQPVKAGFATRLGELDATKTCTSADYHLSDEQRSQIAAALASFDTPHDPETEIRLTMTRLNCVACHERGDFGGPVPERDEFFTTRNLNLGEQARIPPTLTDVGAKLTPTALRKTLVGGESVRPYMNTRMPKFGAAQVERFLELFPQTDQLPSADFERVRDEKVARQAGVELVGEKGLSCIACHTFNGESATTLAGMELTLMAERLQENWFHLYLENPQRFHPTTIMPTFWPGGKPVRPEILDANAGKQIDAIWQYLSRGREARRPAGIRREPIEYGPSEGEAVMLRRQYNGIGKRGIGVGYPAGINLSFDAAQLRLGSIWKGDFAEMSGVWRGQGSGNVGERSRDVVRFPAGPAFAILESPDAEWPVLEQAEKAPGFQLEGYTLDEQQRPTFRYRFGEIKITDRFIDRADGPSLNRTLTFEPAAPDHLHFRAAAAKELAPGDEDGVFVLPRGLRLKLDAEPVVRRIGEEKELLVPLAGRRTLKIEYKFQSP